MGRNFKSTDYYLASFERLNDFEVFKANQESMLFSVYCAGVAIDYWNKDDICIIDRTMVL